MELISTGSDNLDLILNGGLPRRGSYLLRGAPGTGKTVLSNQMAFNHAKNGEKVLYLSGLAENNDTYIYHLSSFSFFQAEDLNKNIFYYSILTLIEESSKVDEMVDRLIEQIQKIDASLLIIDSLQSFDPFFSKKEDIRILINKLKAASTVIDLTMIVMQTTGSQEYHKEASDLDGIIELSLEAFEQKRVRMVEVLKLRGRSYLLGAHSFKITKEGVKFFPRIEVLYKTPLREPTDLSCKLKFGVNELDSMLKGGLTKGSMTTLIGAPGVGKTSLGAKFLVEGCKLGEHGLYVGFNESISRLREKLDGLNISLSKEIDSGNISDIWAPSLDQNIDELLEIIILKVKEKKIKRICIDGITELRAVVDDISRFRSILIAFCNEIKNEGVTGIFCDTLDLFPKSYDIKIKEQGAIMENIINLGYYEHENSLEKYLAIIKIRDGEFNNEYKKIALTSDGISIEKIHKKINLFAQDIKRPL